MCDSKSKVKYAYAMLFMFIHALKSLKKYFCLFQLNFSMHSRQTNDSLEEEVAKEVVEEVLEGALEVSLEGEELVGAQAMELLKNPVMEPLPINPVMGPQPINLPMEEVERASKIYNYQCQVSSEYF